MCGITGIIGLSSAPIKYESILSMTDVISHRGPDGQGFLITNADGFCAQVKGQRQDAVVIPKPHQRHLAFGHRRLSILDLAGSASQPMSDVTGRYWIVFNGEIYNHAVLRKELEAFGYRFNTDHSDTEVILNAYDKWGVDCLQKFNGMWAFCLWDSQRDTFFMARDRSGKKPFYYTVHDNVLYFASELKAIIANKQIPRQLNEKGVYDYLTYLMVPSPHSIFNGIHKLQASHYILLDGSGQLEQKRYWTPLNNKAYVDMSEQQIIEALREKLDESARLRFMADVEVGVLLSGGLDSSINLACLSKYAGARPIKAFAVGFENKNGYTNEFEYARKVAECFNADYHELTLSEEDFINFLPEMIYYQDEPMADPANVPIYYISTIAQQYGVKVLLGGEGSDELFVGYELWGIARQFGNLFHGKPRLAGLAGFLHKNSPVSHKRTYYHGWYEKVKRHQPVFWSGTELRSEREKRGILSKDFLQRLNGYTSFNPMQQLFETYSQQHSQLDSYDWMSATDLQFRLPDLLLARLDRMMMAASVEGRNPFLDVNLIEFAMKIPPHLKNKNGHEKYILKKAFEGILPNEIIYRRKDSFPVPMVQLFKNDAYKNKSIAAIERFNKETNMLAPAYVQQLKTGHHAGELWNISNLAFWHERFK